MLTSIIVFISNLFISWSFSYYISSKANRDSVVYAPRFFNQLLSVIIPIIFVSVLIGFRYDVGVDWQSYVDIYNSFDYSNIIEALTNGNYEWGFSLIVYILRQFIFPSYTLFFCTTLICLVLYYLSFYRFKEILPYGVFTLYTFDTFFLFLNIMRQGISFFFTLYSVKYIKDRNFIKYLLLVFIASGFHKTSIILLPFYLLAYYRKPLLKKHLAFIIYLITWICGFAFFDYLLKFSSLFLESYFIKYTYNISHLNMTESSGLGLLLLHFCDLIIIYYSDKCSRLFKHYGYDIYYNISLVGVIINNIAGLNMLLARIPFCMTSMRIMAGAFTLYYCLNGAKLYNGLSLQARNINKVIGYFFILFASIFFIKNTLMFNYTFVF